MRRAHFIRMRVSITATMILQAVLAMVVIAGASPAAGTVLTYSFTQVGWSVPGFPLKLSGGEILGSFSGEDLNQNGHINLADGEVFSYRVEFRGSIFTPDFTHTLSDLLFFDYTIGSAGFGHSPLSFPLYSSGGGFGYDADDGVILSDVDGIHFLENTFLPALVEALVDIPEPGSLAVLTTAFLAFGGLSFARRRNKSSAKAV